MFIDTDYGPECNISSPKSIQEVATALFVAQTLNKLEYVPGVTMGKYNYALFGRSFDAVTGNFEINRTIRKCFARSFSILLSWKAPWY